MPLITEPDRNAGHLKLTKLELHQKFEWQPFWQQCKQATYDNSLSSMEKLSANLIDGKGSGCCQWPPGNQEQLQQHSGHAERTI